MSDRMNYAAREIMEEGKFAGIKTIERDIDERKKAGHQTKILEIAIESSISAFTLTDLKGILTYVNESFVDLWWYEKEEALGRSITDLFQEGVFTEVLMGLRNVGSWVGELGALRKDGGALRGSAIGQRGQGRRWHPPVHDGLHGRHHRA